MPQKPRFLESVLTMNRHQAEAFQCAYECAVISITDPGSEPIHLKLEDGSLILRLEFHGVDLVCDPDVNLGIAVDGRPWAYWAMQEEDARSVADLVSHIIRLNVPMLVIHCEAGISRSVSMAQALRDFFNNETPRQISSRGHQIHNKHVYQMTYHSMQKLHGVPLLKFLPWSIMDDPTEIIEFCD